MAETPAKPTAWFEPTAWVERRQLVTHLLHNVERPVYLRAPAGGGKTRFLAQLLAQLADEFVVVRLAGAAAPDLVGAVEAALPGSGGETGLTVRLAVAGRPVLVAVDDADALPEPAEAGLTALARAGARVLLVGRGGPSGLTRGGAVELIDLPAFSREETRDFALSIAPAPAGRLVRDGGAALFAATGGLPGRIAKRVVAAGAPTQRGGRLLLWAGGGSLIVLLLLVLWQQDAVNAWLGVSGQRPAQPSPTAAPPPVESTAQLPPVESAAKGAQAESALPEPRVESAAQEPPVESAALDPQAESTAPEPPVEPLVVASVEELPEPVAAEPPPAESAPAPPPAPAGVPPDAAAPQPSAAAPTVQPEPASPPAASEPAPAPAGLLGAEWLWAQPPGHYTLQLVAGRDAAKLRLFGARHGLSGELAMFERERAGKPWFALLAGSFPSRAEALRHRAELPAPLDEQAWLRSFADLRRQLAPAE